MDDKPICYRCRSEIYHHQGTAYYGYYIAHRSSDDCTVYLNRKIQEFEARLVELDWRPVTEKPGHDGRYLIAINYYGRPYTLPALYDHTRGRWQSLNEEMTPTHWRPLPPPPAATE